MVLSSGDAQGILSHWPRTCREMTPTAAHAWRDGRPAGDHRPWTCRGHGSIGGGRAGRCTVGRGRVEMWSRQPWTCGGRGPIDPIGHGRAKKWLRRSRTREDVREVVLPPVDTQEIWSRWPGIRGEIPPLAAYAWRDGRPAGDHRGSSPR